MITSRFTHITPEMAKAWLVHNTANRKLRLDAVAAMARDMENGAWQTTHQGIAFDKNGTLIDGQHRLAAIVKSGVAVDMLVMRGFEPNSINFIDIGTKRKTPDVLAIKYANVPAMRDTMVVSTLAKILRHKLGYGHQPTAFEIEQAELKYPAVVETIYYFGNKHKGCRKTHVMSTALAAAVAGVPVRHIDAFLGVLGKNMIPRDVAYNIKAALDYKDAEPIRNGGDFLQNEKLCQQALWLFYNNRKRLPAGFAAGTIYPLNAVNIETFKGIE